MTPDKLDDLLEQAGVDLGRPERRRERAVRLCNDGMSEVDLEELVDWGHTTRRKLHTVGHWLGWATANSLRWHSVLSGIRKLKESREKRNPIPNVGATVRTSTDPLAAAERQIGMSYCRVRGDGASLEVVAQEFGVTPEQVAAWVEEEERRRANRATAAPKEEEAW